MIFAYIDQITSKVFFYKFRDIRLEYFRIYVTLQDVPENDSLIVCKKA